MKRLKSTLILSALISFLGVATAQQSARDADEAENDSDTPTEPTCFSIRQARSIEAMDDRFIYLEAAGARHFVLTMTPSCPGLRGARGIAVENRGQDRVCTGDLARVAFRPFGNSPSLTCSIGEVTSVESEEAAEALIESLTQ